MQTNAALLKLASGVTLFSGLNRLQLERLLAISGKVTQAAGQLFFDEDEPGDSFLVLLAGSASVEKRHSGHWVPLATLHPGDSFGEMSLVNEPIRSSRVKALEPCVALQFKGQELRQMPGELVLIYRNIARVLARRLKASNLEVAGARLEALGQPMDQDDLPPLEGLKDPETWDQSRY